MAASSRKDAGSGAPRGRKVLDEVLRVAHIGQARVVVSSGSKPHVTITKHVTDALDPHVHSILSGIELVTHGRFGHGSEAAGITEWILKSRDIDVTVRATKGPGG
ncbi:MAG: hypothetical protein HY661_19960 [Betaproteobacteria bacterium]|nr:hypothetical protein [Betaproteobacteria bacterium]